MLPKSDYMDEILNVALQCRFSQLKLHNTATGLHARYSPAQATQVGLHMLHSEASCRPQSRPLLLRSTDAVSLRHVIGDMDASTLTFKLAKHEAVVASDPLKRLHSMEPGLLSLL